MTEEEAIAIINRFKKEDLSDGREKYVEASVLLGEDIAMAQLDYDIVTGAVVKDINA